MPISKIASEFGRIGGKATLKKYGKNYFRNMALTREKKKREERKTKNP